MSPPNHITQSDFLRLFLRHAAALQAFARVPPDTEYLMLRIGMSNDTKSLDKRLDRFAGHFADKVQLVIARRSEIPVP